jgi:hypothetical protein
MAGAVLEAAVGRGFDGGYRLEHVVDALVEAVLGGLSAGGKRQENCCCG